jgi:hypothetical protein
VYKTIAKKIFFSSEKKDRFCHLSFVLDWCPMMHAENCVGTKINLIIFREDEFAKMKGNHTCDGFGMWHVHANPEAPWICPFLSFL